MLGYAEKMKEAARRLFKECKVEVLIGFRRGSLPMMNEPCFVKNAADADQLVWDSNCGINLANYLTNRQEEKIGIFAKGCDSRNIVTHILENKIKREQLVIVGVPCKGMIDRRKINARYDGEITAVTEDETGIHVQGSGFEETLAKADVLQDNCRTCLHKNPVIQDEMLADPVDEQTDMDPYADVRAIEAMTPAEKRQHFDELLSPCIRCYACRNACPLCYCPTCFVDEAKPQWVGKGQEMVNIRTFHFLRAYHCAGRCTDCGACERACPVGIPMRQLTKKLAKDCQELFDWEAGMSLDSRPALDTYRPGDPDEFIK
jgi:formate dehydrogenase (coenzyme F420) beta subunit